MKNVIVERVIHDGESRVALRFPYDTELISVVKGFPGTPVNEKHRVMLSLIYACGLRRSELIELVSGDLERDRKLLRIRQSKGFKDRLVPLSEKVIQLIDLYIAHYKPERYLF